MLHVGSTLVAENAPAFGPPVNVPLMVVPGAFLAATFSEKKLLTLFFFRKDSRREEKPNL